MTIHFHCEHCGKQIEAPKDAGGKRGKCPACKNRIYVPMDTNTDAQEELKLAPLDETDLTHQQKLISETFQITHDILQEKVMPEPETEDTITHVNQPYIPSIQYNDKELKGYIVKYLRLVADGELDRANDILEILSDNSEQAIAIIDQIALTEIPEPELAQIPAQVLSALIRKLRNQISQ